jgi:hypothetical protein
MDSEAREKWEMDLAAPLPMATPKARPIEQVSEQVAEAEGAAFMAAMAMNQRVAGG